MIYILVGLASGIISGMGIGGGAILIPALTIFLDIGQQKAQNINLLYFLPTALFAIFVHKKNGNIEKKGLPSLILWGIPGAITGALIAVKIDANYLRKGFAVFLLMMAAYELTKGYKKWKEKKTTKEQMQ
ncbi:MAG: sulfite exporter TauE/SafE family protein [Defluviitaleaceae bacterium]|nr:sulfite exporter TauE/SafE family protein [Defluviitaleaceae bacterium]